MASFLLMCLPGSADRQVDTTPVGSLHQALWIGGGRWAGKSTVAQGVIQYGDGRREPFSAGVRHQAQMATQARLR